jgi:hypothetical protein
MSILYPVKGFIFMPLAIFVSIWSYDVSVTRITVEHVMVLATTVYLTVISFLSPCPPLLGSWLGPAVSIVVWILNSAWYMRVRCLITVRMERYGQRALLTVGLLTQIGQLFGGLLMFVLVNFYDIFISKPDCVDDFRLYCK